MYTWTVPTVYSVVLGTAAGPRLENSSSRMMYIIYDYSNKVLDDGGNELRR